MVPKVRAIQTSNNRVTWLVRMESTQQSEMDLPFLSAAGREEFYSNYRDYIQRDGCYFGLSMYIKEIIENRLDDPEWDNETLYDMQVDVLRRFIDPTSSEFLYLHDYCDERLYGRFGIDDGIRNLQPPYEVHSFSPAILALTPNMWHANIPIGMIFGNATPTDLEAATGNSAADVDNAAATAAIVSIPPNREVSISPDILALGRDVWHTNVPIATIFGCDIPAENAPDKVAVYIKQQSTSLDLSTVINSIPRDDDDVVIMHGTSSAHVKSILTEGMSSNPWHNNFTDRNEFGGGFYLTMSEHQAVYHAGRKKGQSRYKQGVIMIYRDIHAKQVVNSNDDNDNVSANTLDLGDEYSERWRDIVRAFRLYKSTEETDALRRQLDRARMRWIRGLECGASNDDLAASNGPQQRDALDAVQICLKTDDECQRWVTNLLGIVVIIPQP